MEQARNYVCKECSTPVPSGHKFCGRCGTAGPAEILNLQTKFFGAMQAPGKARLILIRGDQGVDGLSYLLQGTEHVAGRQDAQILFPDDDWLSPRHANFIYRGEKLVVRDEGSVNGVYVRCASRRRFGGGDQFLCGEQVFRLESTPSDTSGPEPGPDLLLLVSEASEPVPRRADPARRMATEWCTARARTPPRIGREENDMNFPEDMYMSGNHARVEMSGDGKFKLVDAGSKNGTYVRINGEHELTTATTSSSASSSCASR